LKFISGYSSTQGPFWSTNGTVHV